MLAVLALAFAVPAVAQTPDRRGEVATDSFTYKGVTANAPIPPSLHIRNEGGSDGAGLCVISSILCNGRYQDVPGLESGKDSLLWRTAKGRPGGYSPDKLANLVNETMPGEKWASYVGRDTSMMEKLSSQGYPVGMTMNTGRQYGYMPIHHMVSLIHYSKKDGVACVVDNNDPGHYHWMPTTEVDRRAFDGGVIWLWTWLRKPANQVMLAIACFVVACCVGASILIVTVASAMRIEPEDFQHG